MKHQIRQEETYNVGIKLFKITPPVASSLLMKTTSMVFLLSSNTAYVVPLSCIYLLPALAASWFLEQKLCCSTDGSSWLRAAHSLIFPLAPRAPGRRAALGAALQLLMGNLAVVALASTVALMEGVVDNIFVTPNIVKATTAMSALLILHTTATYAAVFILPVPSTPSPAEDDIEEGDDESTESTPLISIQHGDEGKKRIRTAAWVLLLPTTLALILASPYPLLLHQFNTCPALPSDSNSHVTCPSTNSTPTVGAVCHLTCSPLYWSSSSLSTACTWRGAWDVGSFTCRPQAAALVGPRASGGGGWEAGAEVWPAAANRSLLPPLPVDYRLGTAGYLSGSLYYCGGADRKDPSLQSRPACHSLRPPARQWEETAPLLQVRPRHPPLPLSQAVWGASSAVIDNGRALWVLGGADKDHYIQSSTQIVRPGRPTQPGPAMTEAAAFHSSVMVPNGTDWSVMVTGGRRRSNLLGSPRTEVFSFSTGEWSRRADMQHRRFGHSCAAVWLDPQETQGIIPILVDRHSVMSVVVGGGEYGP